MVFGIFALLCFFACFYVHLLGKDSEAEVMTRSDSLLTSEFESAVSKIFTSSIRPPKAGHSE
jgi:hypothetical protein